MNASTRRLLTGYGWFDHRDDLRAHAPVRPELIVCHECDAVYSRRTLASSEMARCARCDALLGRGHFLTVDGQLALTIAALLVFITGNLSDIVTMNLGGAHSEVTLYESIRSTWQTGQRVVAILAGATAFAFPLAVILLRLYVLLPLNLGRRVSGFVPAMRVLRWVTRWSMVEVFLFGALVAIVKSAGLASVILGVGLFSYAVLTFLLAANQAVGLHGLWHRASELPT